LAFSVVQMRPESVSRCQRCALVESTVRLSAPRIRCTWFQSIFSKPPPPIAFACVENYLLGHSAFTAIPNLIRLSVFLPFSLQWCKVGK
jgi:hypothetical protein